MSLLSINEDNRFTIKLKRLIYLSLFSVVLFLNYNFSNDYIALLCLLICCFVIFNCKRNDLLPLALYFSAFAYLFRYGQFNTYFITQICFIVRCFFERGNLLKVYIPLIFSYFVFHLVSTDVSTLRIGTIIPFLGMIVLLCSSIIYEESIRQKCIQHFIVGFLTASLLGLNIASNRLNLILDENEILLENGNLFHRYGGLLPDCNFYTMFSVVAVCIVALQYKSGLTGVNRLIFLFSLLGLGGITFSKSFYMSVIIILLVLMFLNKNFKFILGILISTIVIFNFFGDEINLVLGATLDRFTSSTDDAQSFTNGRFEYWIIYLKDIFSNFINAMFGHGAEQLPRGHIVAHNTYLEIIYKFGIVGLLFDFYYLFTIKNKIVHEKSFSIVNVLPLFLLTLLMFNLSAFSFYPLWSLFLITFIAWNTNKKECYVK